MDKRIYIYKIKSLMHNTDLYHLLKYFWLFSELIKPLPATFHRGNYDISWSDWLIDCVLFQMFSSIFTYMA